MQPVAKQQPPNASQAALDAMQATQERDTAELTQKLASARLSEEAGPTDVHGDRYDVMGSSYCMGNQSNLEATEK